jgi:hypothetical protein
LSTWDAIVPCIYEFWPRETSVQASSSSDRPSSCAFPALQLRNAGKWTQDPLDYAEEALLTRLEPFIPGAGDHPRHYFFSRAGFSPPLQRLAAADPERYRLVTPADMYA